MKRELDESKAKCEESERKRKFSDSELHDMTENIHDLKSSNEYLSNCKRKLERDLSSISVSFEEEKNLITRMMISG